MSVPRLEFEIPFPPSPSEDGRKRRHGRPSSEVLYLAEVRKRFRAVGPITFQPTSISLVVSEPKGTRLRADMVIVQIAVLRVLSLCNAFYLRRQLDHVEVVRGDADKPGVVVILEGTQ